jgi:hypothetical protein
MGKEDSKLQDANNKGQRDQGKDDYNPPATPLPWYPEERKKSDWEERKAYDDAWDAAKENKKNQK